MKPYAVKFYTSPAWKHCKDSYLQSVGRLCERCLSQGKIVTADVVHHKIHITPENIGDPTITLNHGNLMALCQDCHAEVHKQKKRWRVDERGNVMTI